MKDSASGVRIRYGSETTNDPETAEYFSRMTTDGGDETRLGKDVPMFFMRTQRNDCVAHEDDIVQYSEE